MTFEECKLIVNLCENLTGKTIENKYIMNLFTAPLDRERTKEMMDNIINDKSYLNEQIILNNQYFEVLALIVNHDAKDEKHKFTVTPIQEVLTKIFDMVNSQSNYH